MENEGPCSSHGLPSLRITITQRGRELLSRAGYEYTLKRNNKDGSKLWRCAKKKVCNAIIKTKCDPMMILNETAHCHGPNDLEESEIKEQLKICSKAVQKYLNTSVIQIFDKNMQVLKDKGLHLVTKIPAFQNVQNRLYTKRNNSVGAKKIFFNRAVDVEVPKKYEHLLLGDYKEKRKRILIFAGEKMRKYLKQTKQFFIDGTFKICPKTFYQLHTIHADVGSNEHFVNIVPIIYALLPDKKTSTYEDLFAIIKSQIPEWDPIIVNMDFEMPAMTALRNVFPRVKIVGCGFHFKRSLYRKAKELGVLKNVLGKVHVQLCASLSHLPPKFIDEGWLYIMEESPNTAEVTSFNDYFVRTWFENSTLAYTWCTFGEPHKTNNAVEQWNSHIRKFIKIKPNIAQLLEGLQRDVQYYSAALEGPTSIQISKRRPETIARHKRITSAINDLVCGQINIGHCLEKLRF